MTQSAGSLWKIGRQFARRVIPVALGFGITAAPVTSPVAQAKTWLQQVIGNQNKNKYPNYPPPAYYQDNGGYGGGWQGQPYYAPPPVIVVPQPQAYCDTGHRVQILGYDQDGGAITNPGLPSYFRLTPDGEVLRPC